MNEGLTGVEKGVYASYTRYLLLADYASYAAAQGRVEALYGDRQQWTRRAILNVAGMGKFTSDRAIREYASRIWGAKPVLD